MTDDIAYWRDFWGDKTDPLHTYKNQKHYSEYGKELSVLLPSDVNAVLDLGCGSGALYKPLRFDKAKLYVGVDLSKSMLDEFQTDYPNLSLHEGDAGAYKDDNKYDLIFSNAVIQYFSLDMLRQQMEKALGMLSENGTIIHSSIPWKALQKKHAFGYLTYPYKSKGIKAALFYLANSLGLMKNNTMGRWYSIEEFEKIAEEFGLSAKFHGSMYYPYRFHVTLKRM
jgi:predicted TPR repeat methyltransferase